MKSNDDAFGMSPQSGVGLENGSVQMTLTEMSLAYSVQAERIVEMVWGGRHRPGRPFP